MRQNALKTGQVDKPPRATIDAEIIIRSVVSIARRMNTGNEAPYWWHRSEIDARNEATGNHGRALYLSFATPAIRSISLTKTAFRRSHVRNYSRLAGRSSRFTRKWNARGPFASY